MARKELLVAGFRNVKQVAKSVQARKAAAATGYATNKFAAVPPKAAPPPAKSAAPAKQTGAAVAQRSGREHPTPPSFAASSAAPAGPSRFAGGLFSGFNLKSAATAVLGQRGQPPSFAAAPVWGSRAATPSAPAAAEAASSRGAGAGTAAATKAAKQVPAAVSGNPLYKLAKLGSPAGASAPAATADKAGELGALGRYAKLGQAGQQPAAAKGMGAAAALLKYAKMVKK